MYERYLHWTFFFVLFVCFPFSLKEQERQYQEDLNAKDAEIERYHERYVISITKFYLRT